MMEDWQKHIGPRGGTALCGSPIGPFEWAFEDAEHATLSVATGDRLVPCPECWEEITKAAPEQGEG